MNESPVRLVMFDLGGVIVRVASWEQAHAAAGLDPARFPGAAFTTSVLALVRQFDGGALEPADFEARVVGLSGGAYTVDDVRRVHDAIVVDELPGLDNIFSALEGAGIETGILSNTNPVHWQTLAALDDRPPRFPAILRARHVYASHLLRLLKPDRAIFDAVVAASGFSPAEILFFDDVEANVLGARDAGWRAERIEPGGDSARQLLAHLRRHVVLGPAPG